MLERARALAPLLEDLSERTEQERRLPEPVQRALFDAALFRLLLPRFLAGGEVDPVTFVQVIEEIARKQIPEVWLNPGAESDALIARAQALDIHPTLACSIVGIGQNPYDL